MRLQVQKPTHLRDLLRDAGVPEADLGLACQKIAAVNPALRTDAPLDVGTQFEVPDAYYRDVFQPLCPERGDSFSIASEGPINATLAGRVSGTQRVGVLGGRDLQVVSNAPPSIGRSSVQSMNGLAEALAAIDKGEIDIEFPLRPGVWGVPTPNGNIEVKAVKNAKMSVTAQVAPGPKGLRIQGAEFALHPPLILENLDALTKDVPLGFLARAAGRVAPKVALEGLTLNADGSLNPKFCMAGSPGIKVPIPNLILPRIEMDAKNLLSGDYFKSLGLLPLVLGPDFPQAMTSGSSSGPALEAAQFVQAFGALTQEGRFRVHAEGNGSLVDLNSNQTRLQRSDSPFAFTLEGSVHASDQGLVTLMSELRSQSDLGDWRGGVRADAKAAGNRLEGNINLEGEANPGDRLSKISISTNSNCASLAGGTIRAELKDKELALEIGGRTASLIENVAGFAQLKLGDGMKVQIEGNALVAADFAFRLEPNHLHITDGKVSGRVELGGTQGENALKGVILGRGSALEFRADANAEVDGNTLRFNTPEFQLSVENVSVKKGPLSAALKNGQDNATVTGSGSVEFGSAGPDGEIHIHLDARARPKLLGIPAPLAPGVEGEVLFEVTPHGGRWMNHLNLKW